MACCQLLVQTSIRCWLIGSQPMTSTTEQRLWGSPDFFVADTYMYILGFVVSVEFAFEEYKTQTKHKGVSQPNIATISLIIWALWPSFGLLVCLIELIVLLFFITLWSQLTPAFISCKLIGINVRWSYLSSVNPVFLWRSRKCEHDIVVHLAALPVLVLVHQLLDEIAGKCNQERLEK